MSGELLLAVGCGAVLVVTGIIAYVWTLRSYSKPPSDAKK